METLVSTQEKQKELALLYRAYSFSDHFNIKSYKEVNSCKLISSNSNELYYQLDEYKFIYILSYGTVVFLNFDHEDELKYIDLLKDYCTNPYFKLFDDALQVSFNKDAELGSSFSMLTIDRFDHDVNKIIMLNLAQSVTLDKYTAETEAILSEVKAYTFVLYSHGKIGLNQRDTMKFIGKTLTTKNSIAENLYIIDTPDRTWDIEFINNLHKNLTVYFELNTRHRAIENMLHIIEDNLAIFSSFNHHKESSRLEWIIIILIIIEVVDTLVSKFL